MCTGLFANKNLQMKYQNNIYSIIAGMLFNQKARSTATFTAVGSHGVLDIQTIRNYFLMVHPPTRVRQSPNLVNCIG